MNRILLATIPTLIWLTSCQPTPTPLPLPSPTSLPPTMTLISWKPASVAEVNSKASTFDALVRVQGDGWRAEDQSAFRAIYADNAVMKDATYGDYVVGVNEILGIVNSVTIYFPSWKSQILENYISQDGGVTLDHLWNLKPGKYSFTQSDPLVEVDWLQAKNNLITRWTLFYGLDSMEKGGETTQPRLEQARSLLRSYQSAWSSGDLETVAKLYSNEATREDTIMGERSEGRDAIAAHAKSLFTRFPNAKWSLSLGFGEGFEKGSGQEPITGGLFTISVSDPDGHPCDLREAVLLQVSEDKIIQENLFYEPDSLIKCGWAQ